MSIPQFQSFMHVVKKTEGQFCVFWNYKIWRETWIFFLDFQVVLQGTLVTIAFFQILTKTFPGLLGTLVKKKVYRLTISFFLFYILNLAYCRSLWRLYLKTVNAIFGSKIPQNGSKIFKWCLYRQDQKYTSS